MLLKRRCNAVEENYSFKTVLAGAIYRATCFFAMGIIKHDKGLPVNVLVPGYYFQPILFNCVLLDVLNLGKSLENLLK